MKRGNNNDRAYIFSVSVKKFIYGLQVFEKYPAIIRKNPNLTTNEKIILWEILSWTHDPEDYWTKTGKHWHDCFPSLSSLGESWSMSIDTVRRAIKCLLKKGYIQRSFQKGYSNIYHLTPKLLVDSLRQTETILKQISLSDLRGIIGGKITNEDILKELKTDPLQIARGTPGILLGGDPWQIATLYRFLFPDLDFDLSQSVKAPPRSEKSLSQKRNGRGKSPLSIQTSEKEGARHVAQRSNVLPFKGGQNHQEGEEGMDSSEKGKEGQLNDSVGEDFGGASSWSKSKQTGREKNDKPDKRNQLQRGSKNVSQKEVNQLERIESIFYQVTHSRQKIYRNKENAGLAVNMIEILGVDQIKALFEYAHLHWDECLSALSKTKWAIPHCDKPNLDKLIVSWRYEVCLKLMERKSRVSVVLSGKEEAL